MLGTTEDGWIFFEDGSSCSEPEFEIVTRDGKIVAIDVQRKIEGGDDSEAAHHARQDAIHLRASIDDLLSRRLPN